MSIPKGVEIPEKSYAREIAEKITGPFNQSHSLLLVGKQGSGKSWAAIKMAYEVAKEMAKIKGGTWEDYFTLDHVGIITVEEIKRVISIMKQFGIYIFDDVGVGWKSRRSQSAFNLALNDIFTTWRTENTFLICTVPDSFLLDKVPRSLVVEFGEVELNVFEKNLTIIKLFEVHRKPREQKTYFVYPFYGGKQYVRLVVFKPPSELTEPYEVRRKEIARKLKEDKLAQFGEPFGKDNGEEGNGIVKTKKEMIIALAQKGYTKHHIATQVNTSVRYVYSVLNNV